VIGRRATHRSEAPVPDLPALDFSAGTAVAGGDAPADGGQDPGVLGRWWTSLKAAATPDPAASPEDDLDLKPTAMRRPEPLYGYVVGLELIFVSILNLTVTHGKGAPAHPATLQAAVGLVASLAFIAIIRTNHRFIVAFGAVIAAFCVISLSRTPDSLLLPHLFAFAIPIIYAFMLSQRQRKAATARTRAGRSGSTPAKGAGSGRGRAADSGRRRGRKDKDSPSGPQASRRYTPPKPKRTRP
jgi:hypothetical protein